MGPESCVATSLVLGLEQFSPKVGGEGKRLPSHFLVPFNPHPSAPRTMFIYFQSFVRARKSWWLHWWQAFSLAKATASCSSCACLLHFLRSPSVLQPRAPLFFAVGCTMESSNRLSVPMLALRRTLRNCLGYMLVLQTRTDVLDILFEVEPLFYEIHLIGSLYQVSLRMGKAGKIKHDHSRRQKSELRDQP